MPIKDTLIFSGIILGVLMSIITLAKMVYGQGKARGREERFVENLSKIDVQLTNHITDLKNTINSLHIKFDDLLKIQNKCRREMEGRVSKMEGKLNGYVPHDLRQG